MNIAMIGGKTMKCQGKTMEHETGWMTGASSSIQESFEGHPAQPWEPLSPFLIEEYQQLAQEESAEVADFLPDNPENNAIQAIIQELNRSVQHSRLPASISSPPPKRSKENRTKKNKTNGRPRGKSKQTKQPSNPAASQKPDSDILSPPAQLWKPLSPSLMEEYRKLAQEEPSYTLDLTHFEPGDHPPALYIPSAIPIAASLAKQSLSKKKNTGIIETTIETHGPWRPPPGLIL
jgi:hypothetical protein